MKTNQSFIKAYRQDAAEPAPTRPARAHVARPTVAIGTSVEFVSASTAQPDALIAQPVAAPDRESAVSPATVWPTCDAPFGRIEPPKRENAIGKRPLSAFTSHLPRVAARDAPPASPPTTRFEPGTTVASFSWPRVCRALCQQCSSDFDRVVDRLVCEADAGRTLVGILGLFPEMGATTTTLCLAARLARRRRTIVVEANFRAPRLAAWLETTPTAWWQDVLERNVPTADAVIHATDDNLDVLALDRKTSNPLQLAGRLQAFNTGSALPAAYDVVLADLGPFFDPDSQPILLELVRNMRFDAAIVVAGPQGADTRDLATIDEYLEERGCELLGTIENRTAKMQATD